MYLVHSALYVEKAVVLSIDSEYADGNQSLDWLAS
jgi:hypothetical protein